MRMVRNETSMCNVPPVDPERIIKTAGTVASVQILGNARSYLELILGVEPIYKSFPRRAAAGLFSVNAAKLII